MSEHDGSDGKVGAFLLGFLVGVLVCLGGGGVLYVTHAREATQERMRAMQAAEEAARARDMAEHASRQALMERARAEKALEAAKKAKEEK